jgi:hypothetical protein
MHGLQEFHGVFCVTSGLASWGKQHVNSLCHSGYSTLFRTEYLRGIILVSRSSGKCCGV